MDKSNEVLPMRRREYIFFSSIHLILEFMTCCLLKIFFSGIRGNYCNVSASGVWDVLFSGDWNMSFWGNYNTSFLGRLKCYFFGGLNMSFSGNWSVTFSGNEKIELSSFWKTESFILLGRNHAHKKNLKSKPRTKYESKHMWGTSNAYKICDEIHLRY